MRDYCKTQHTMDDSRTTRASAKRLPAERTTRNSRKTPAYLCKPLSARTRISSRKSMTPISGAQQRSAGVKHETDIIESSQDPAQQLASDGDPMPSTVFVIERDTCQMSPLLFDSDSDSAPHSPHDDNTTVIIPNNQQQALGKSSPSSSSEPLLDLPTSTTETDTDISQCLPPTAGGTSITPQRRRHTFRSFKCTPARLTRLTALRNNRPAAGAVTPTTSTSARMAPPPKKTNIQPKRSVTAASRTKYPSSSSEFSVASDISAVMQARRNVIRTDSDADPDAVAVEPYEQARPQRAPVPLNPCSFDDLHLRLLPREPSTSQELQIIEHKNVIITLSSGSRTEDNEQQASAANTKDRTRRDRGRTPEDSATIRRSPDLFDTFDDEFEAVPALPRRTASFFERPRCDFFARLNTQAAALTSTPIRTPPQRRDESIDIFGDNATFIETPHRPTELEDVPRLTDASGHRQNAGGGGEHSTTTNTTSLFEITKNDVFPHLIRVNSDSDMSPIKMSDEEPPPPSTPAVASVAGVQRTTSAFALPRKMPTWKENFVDPDVLNTGVIASSQDQQQRTPLKLTLYERLCRTDPSRQFSGPRRRKASAVRPLHSPGGPIRTPDRKPRRRKSLTGAAPTSTSPESKRRQRLQKWSSDERAAAKTATTSKTKWTGRRLEDYFAKAGTSSSASCSAAPAKTVQAVKVVPPSDPKTQSDRKRPQEVAATIPMLILSSDDERS